MKDLSIKYRFFLLYIDIIKLIFKGFSVPRNNELMRVYKDLDLVEHLGSGGKC